MISVYNLHHSPAVWDDPEAFLPERFDLDGPIPSEQVPARPAISAHPRLATRQHCRILVPVPNLFPYRTVHAVDRYSAACGRRVAVITFDRWGNRINVLLIWLDVKQYFVLSPHKMIAEQTTFMNVYEQTYQNTHTISDI